MFYEYINEKTIKNAPNPLKINGKDIFTNSEKIYNENGYYRLESAEYPQGDKYYEPRYLLNNGVITQYWVEISI